MYALYIPQNRRLSLWVDGEQRMKEIKARKTALVEANNGVQREETVEPVGKGCSICSINERCTICLMSFDECKEKKDNKNQRLCEMCWLIQDVNLTDATHAKYTEDRFGHVISALLPSPVSWLWIGAIGSSNDHMLLMLVVNIIVFIITFTSPLSDYSMNFCGPFSITTQRDLRIMHVIQHTVNAIFLVELARQYVNGGNAVYECHWMNFEEDSNIPPEDCLLYLHLLGNSFIIYFCSLFVNVACMRTLTKSDGKSEEKWNQKKEGGLNQEEKWELKRKREMELKREEE